MFEWIVHCDRGKIDKTGVFLICVHFTSSPNASPPWHHYTDYLTYLLTSCRLTDIHSDSSAIATNPLTNHTHILEKSVTMLWVQTEMRSFSPLGSNFVIWYTIEPHSGHSHCLPQSTVLGPIGGSRGRLFHAIFRKNSLKRLWLAYRNWEMWSTIQ